MASDLVLSFHSVALYPEDIALLQGHWLNDSILSFWFEVLQHKCGLGSDVTFVPPALVLIMRFEQGAYKR